MIVEKEKIVWTFRCHRCKTSVDVSRNDYRLDNANQDVDFFIRPEVHCGKCDNICILEEW